MSRMSACPQAERGLPPSGERTLAQATVAFPDDLGATRARLQVPRRDGGAATAAPLLRTGRVGFGPIKTVRVAYLIVKPPLQPNWAWWSNVSLYGYRPFRRNATRRV